MSILEYNIVDIKDGVHWDEMTRGSQIRIGDYKGPGRYFIQEEKVSCNRGCCHDWIEIELLYCQSEEAKQKLRDLAELIGMKVEDI